MDKPPNLQCLQGTYELDDKPVDFWGNLFSEKPNYDSVHPGMALAEDMGEKPPEEEKPAELYPIMGLAQKRTQVRTLATISWRILYCRYFFEFLRFFW